MKRLAVVVAIGLGSFGTQARAQSPDVWIGAESATFLEYNVVPRPDGAYHFLRDIEVGPDRDIPADGTGTIWISGTMSHSGSQSVGVHAYPSVYDPAVNNRDRAEIRVVHGESDSFALRNATTRYFGYAFMLHEQMDAPTGWLHVMQVWQRTAPNATPMGKVPFTMSLSDQLRLEARTRTQDTTTLIWVSDPIEKGEWHTLAYELRPSYNGDGHGGSVTIWLDSVEVVRWVGDWGNPPSLGYTEYYDVRCGVYRQAQPNHTIIMYDDILYMRPFR